MKLLQSVFFFLAFSFNSFGLIWPTPNPAFAKGEPIEAFVQATGSGNTSSGLYGMVRNNGKRFHEGLDLFGIQFDSKKEVLDSIYAVLPGQVVHINEDSSKSSYGIYVVLSHKAVGLNFYSLYALQSGLKTIVTMTCLTQSLSQDPACFTQQSATFCDDTLQNHNVF